MDTSFLLTMRRFVLLTCAIVTIGTMALYAEAPKMFGSIPEIHIIGGCGMVPLQPTVDFLIDTTWAIDKDTGKITVSFPKDYSFVCTLNKKEAQINGKDVKLQVAPFERLGIIYIPSESLTLACKGTAKIDQEKSVVEMSFDGPNGMYTIYLPYNMAKIFPTVDSYRDSDTELYIVATDGNGHRRLSYNTSNDGLPVFPPNATADNLRIIYQRAGSIFIRDVKDRYETTLVKALVQTMMPGMPGMVPPPPPPANPAVGAANEFTEGGDYEPECVSPDGSLLYFTQRYRMLGMGANEDDDVQDPTGLGAGGPAGAPGGMFGAPANVNICTCPLEGGTEKPKLLISMADSPSLSSDGKLMLYTNRMIGGGPAMMPPNGGGGMGMMMGPGMGMGPSLMVVDPTNTTQPKMVGMGMNPSFSPNNRAILYTTSFMEAGGKMGLVVYISQGGRTPFIARPKPEDLKVNEVAGGFSPDSKKIVFGSGTGISTMKPDRTGVKQLTTNDQDTRPLYTPDGNQIVFLRGTDLYIMDSDGENVKQLTKDVKVLKYRIAPGAKQIFFLARPEALPKAATPAVPR